MLPLLSGKSSLYRIEVQKIDAPHFLIEVEEENEYNISFFPYYEIFFYPFILNKEILDLKGYYEYLKKNKVIIDFYPKEEDLRKKLQI